MIQRLIDYRCVIWGSYGDGFLMKVDEMMKQFARVILNVKDRGQSSTVTNLTDLFVLNNIVHKHHTRS